MVSVDSGNKFYNIINNAQVGGLGIMCWHLRYSDTGVM